MRGRQLFKPCRVAIAWIGHDPVAGETRIVVDPALDMGPKEIAEYWQSRFDPSKLKLRPGEQPSWFTLEQPTTGQEMACPSDRAADLQTWYLLCSLSKIENYPVIAADGTERQHSQPDREDRGGKLGCMASHEWLSSSQLGRLDRLALSEMARHLAEAPAPSSRTSAGPSGVSASSDETAAQQ